MSKYIDADALKDAVEDWFGDDYGFVVKDVNYIVDEMPAADVEPVRHGEWIQVLLFDKFPVKCSVCGYERFAKPLNYCPDCGAKMDGGSENEQRNSFQSKTS